MFDVRVRSHFDFLSAEYETLFETSDATPFQHPIWLRHLYDVLAPVCGAEPVIVVVRRADGRLAMVLPLLRRRRGPLTLLEFADLGVSDYVSPVCDRATFAALVGDAQRRRCIVGALGRFDLMRIEKIRADGLSLAELFRVPASVMDESAHAMPLHGPSADWRPRYMLPEVAREIERKWRQLERVGNVRFERVVDPQAIEATLEAMRAFRERRFGSRPGTDLLQDRDYFRFYRNVAVAGAASGFVRVSRLSIDSQTVAADLSLHLHGVSLGLLTGFDQQGHKNRSLGRLMMDALLAASVARGDTWFDFTVGDEAYKKLFGTRPTGLLAVTARGSLIGSLAALAAERLPRVHQTAKRLLGASER